MTATTTEASPALRLRLATERRRRAGVVRETWAALAGLPVIDEHPALWSQHPVPYCGTCDGGETWPCPPVLAALKARTAVAR